MKLKDAAILFATAVGFCLLIGLTSIIPGQSARGSAYSVGDSAYSGRWGFLVDYSTYTGIWESRLDYQARILTVRGVAASPCTSGAVYLGDSRYRVPVGVWEFNCEEGSAE